VKFTGLIALVVVLHLFAVMTLSESMSTRPLLNRLGYVPEPGVMKLLSLDQKEMTAFSLVLKVLMYFGGAVDERLTTEESKVNYDEMYEMVKTATRLDPYNMDAYYFAQAILTWDIGEIDKANELLEYGVEHRNWDWYLPFFIGFNKAYFQKNYAEAAKYYALAGKLSRSTLYKQLAGRYMYESGQTDMAINYLNVMVENARTDAIRQAFTTRLQALEGVKKIELAVEKYKRNFGRLPDDIRELLQQNMLDSLPIDPYGGEFYLTKNGRVKSTSKFASGFAKKK